MVRFLILFLFLSNYAFAASKNLYQVEVIVFENIKHIKDEEILPKFSGDLSLSKTIKLKKDINFKAQSEYPTFAELEPESWNLVNEHRILARSANYRVVEHKAWRQHIKNNRNSQTVHITGGNNLGKLSNGLINDWELEGTVNISRHGVFYCKTDFILKRVNLDQKNNDFVIDEQPMLDEFRITQSAKMKIKNIQFFDHPLFGVLVSVKEIKE